MSERTKDKVRDYVERKFDKIHKVADVITAPIAPIDGAIHGVARGIHNWLLDIHPNDGSHPHPDPAPAPAPAPTPGPYNYPTPPGPYNYPTPPPPGPPPYYNHYSQPAPSYSYKNSGDIADTGNNNNSSHQENNGALKLGNIGSS